MRFKAAVLSTTLASLLLATSALAVQDSAPEGRQHAAGGCSQSKEGKFRKLARMEHRLDRAVEQGRLTQAQADQFKAEARQLHDQAEAQRQSSGGELTDAQREQLRQRKQELRAKMKAALKATAPQDV